jgi:hypothetical protein
MNHPQILLVPVLMEADYLLTVAGAILNEKGYQKHFRREHYELNPVWQKSIKQKKFFNFRHFALTVFVTVVFLICFSDCADDDPNLQSLLGFIFVFFGIIIGRHLSNLMTFWHVLSRPQDISGEVRISQRFSLCQSVYQLSGFGLVLAAICLFSPSPFAFGGLIAVILFVLLHACWIIKDVIRVKKQRANIIQEQS